MDADVRSAVARSHLASLPPAVLAELVAGASRVRIPAAALTHREGDPAPHLELVVSGVVRVSVTAPDGRTMTVRYCRAGARDVRVANAFLGELSERVLSFVNRVRPTLVAPVSQRELAEAVGTVREVVVRILRELRTEGVVRTGRDEIVIVDPGRLIHEQGWNPGS